jgi:hypothetical protein
MYDLVTDPATHDGRLAGSVQLSLIDSSQPTALSGAVPFDIVAARDVAALAARAVVHTAPAPEARDAETTKLVHVDFAEADLPWRYTPRLAAGDRLPPWMVLIVGTTEELRVDGPAVTVLQPSVLQAHDLADSPRWAHVQHDGQRVTSRLLSPRRLEPETEYVVALVAAFDDAGRPMSRSARASTTTSARSRMRSAPSRPRGRRGTSSLPITGWVMQALAVWVLVERLRSLDLRWPEVSAAAHAANVEARKALEADAVAR